MKKSSPGLRPATREDIEKFSPVRNKPSIRAWCMDRDGEILALGGVARIKGRWVAFMDLEPDARPHKMKIARGAIRFFSELRKDGIKFVYAQPDLDEPASVRWMTSLGFRPMNEVYRWRL